MSPLLAGDTRQIDLAIQGMTCASCAARVEKKLGKIEGVSAVVNYATGTARITAPPEVSVLELAGAVERAGYRAEPTERAETCEGIGAGAAHNASERAETGELAGRESRPGRGLDAD